jgi:UrcA family protein
MVMDSNKLSAVQCRRNHSTFNGQSVKASVMSVTKIVRTYAIRIAWLVFASVPISTIVTNAAQAGEPVDTPPHKVVSFRDLNLNSPEGVAALYGRIKSAAYDACGNPDRFDLSQLKLQTCIKDAVSRAIADVNSPMLTSLYQAETGKADKQTATLAQAH